MKSIAKKSFTAELVLERSITPLIEQLGKHDCTLELFQHSETVYNVEWDVPELDETVNIGIWIDESCPYRKVIREYDGVFSVPAEIEDFLSECGFNCDYLH